MSARNIKAPNTQKRLTNIVVVRLTKGGSRFEIACYPNKVEEWKRKIETDIDEVLQRQAVFTNVSKGELAKLEDIKKAFNTNDQSKVCRIILDSGQIQVSEKERKQDNEKLFKDIASLIVEKCINSQTQQAFTVGVIENAMREIHVSINPHQSAKAQALKIIQALQEKSSLPIERAKMKLLLVVSKDQREEVKTKLKPLIVEVTQEDVEEGNNVSWSVTIEPKNFREVDGCLKAAGGACEVLQHSVKMENDVKF
eukprot:TRINITY_DN1931_c0_g1_i3.p1 TRINITY_DN1931_c0_g1~~TRINITY_DN1931_c0_g1_i3.p1  ORF type:complete len:254 (+),score=50.52 TRINITY_DN1931_c0_g1_i3:155-916(+)